MPPAVDNPEVYAVRSGGIVLPNGVNGIEATLDVQQGRVRQADFEAGDPDAKLRGVASELTTGARVVRSANPA